MECRMTVVQALEERDLLIKRISKYTKQGKFVDLMGPGSAESAHTWAQRMTGAEFAARADGTLQRIRDLTARYDRLTEAILASNASVWLETTRGRMTVAAAVALRNRMRGGGPCGDMTDFEGKLIRQMRDQHEEMRKTCKRKSASSQRGGEASKGRREKAGGGKAAERAGISIAIAREEQGEKLRLFDPLDILQKAEEMEEEREEFLVELETGIRISNATTYVTV